MNHWSVNDIKLWVEANSPDLSIYKKYYWNFGNIHCAQKKSNVYYGSSNVLGPIYQVIEIPIGSEIHNLHGGIFVVLPNNSVFRISRPTINKNSLKEISNHKKVSYNID